MPTMNLNLMETVMNMLILIHFCFHWMSSLLMQSLMMIDNIKGAAVHIYLFTHTCNLFHAETAAGDRHRLLCATRSRATAPPRRLVASPLSPPTPLPPPPPRPPSPSPRGALGLLGRDEKQGRRAAGSLRRSAARSCTDGSMHSRP